MSYADTIRQVLEQRQMWAERAERENGSMRNLLRDAKATGDEMAESRDPAIREYGHKLLNSLLPPFPQGKSQVRP